MSLINQMLRDLEQRNPAGRTNPPSQQTLDIKPSQPPPRGGYRPTVWLAGILLTGIIWLYWRPQAPAPSEPAASAAQAKPRPPVPAAVPALLPATPQSAAVPAAPAVETEPALADPGTATAVLPAAEPLPDAPDQPTPTQTASKPSKTAAAMPAKPSRNQPAKPPQRAETLFRQAENSASRLMQQEYLREALQLDPRYLPARQKLLGILAREPASLELKHFLDESLALFPGNLKFITTLAHYHVRQKNFPAAIASLEQVDDYAVNDLHYLALLAAAYQQQQQFAKALPVYQKLVRLQPEKAENWLGLGICSDKLQQPAGAVRAYRQALDKNALDPQVVDYINQRLNALTH